MFCFYQKSDKVFNVPVNIMQGLGFNILSVPDSREHPSMNEVYITTQSDALRYNEYVNKIYKDSVEIFQVNESVFDTIKMPFMIGDSQSIGYRDDIELIEAISAFYKDQKRKITIAIFFGSNKAYGDLMCLLSVIKEVNRTLKEKKIDVEIVLLKTTDAIGMGFTAQSIIPEIQQKMLPICLEEMQSFDFLLEVKDVDINRMKNEDFHDIYAKMFNFELPKDFNPKGDFQVRTHQKSFSKQKMENLFSKKLPILSFNSVSNSPLRTMPNSIKTEIIMELLNTGKFNIVSFDPLNNVLDIKHPNYIVLSTYTVNFEDYASFLSSTDGIISVDSAPLHLAARLDLPSIGIYTTINPDFREKYYENADSLFFEKEFDNLKNENDIEKAWKKIDVNLIVKKIIKKFKKGIF